jgi:hypothetical protein
MPRGNFTQRGVAAVYGEGYRRCPRCGIVASETSTFFYIRPSTGRGELCVTCRPAYYAEYHATRRADAIRAESVGDNRKFGVEIEFEGDGHEVARAMNDNGLACEYEDYNHQTRARWKIVSDSSVDSGAELVSPPLQGDEGRRQIKRACQALRAAEASVNMSCGLHVHHEVTDLRVGQFQRLYRLWSNCADAIDSLVAPSRRGGEWARHINDRDISYVDTLTDTSRESVDHVARQINRYKTLNLQSYPRYGTVEIRLHQGTTNADKILNWIALGQSTVTYAKTLRALPGEGINLSGLLFALEHHGDMTADTSAYLSRRAEVLSIPATIGSGADADDVASQCDSDDDIEDYCSCRECREDRDGYADDDGPEW